MSKLLLHSGPQGCKGEKIKEISTAPRCGVGVKKLKLGEVKFLGGADGARNCS